MHNDAVGKEQGLLAEIERDLLDGKPLADLLRKCVILGGRAGSQELRDWATQELKGYESREGLPPHRLVYAPILMDAVTGSSIVTGQHLPSSAIPEGFEALTEEVPLLPGVGQLESIVMEGKTVQISVPMYHAIAAVIDEASGNPFQQIHRMYWAVPVTAFAGCLDQIRTVLAELIAELRSVVPDSQPSPTSEQASNAIHVAIHGKKSRANVVVNSAQGAGESSPEVHTAPAPAEESAWWTLGRKIGAIVVGLATIAGAYWAYVAVR